jgi:hypothetical protein
MPSMVMSACSTVTSKLKRENCLNSNPARAI